MWSFTPKQTRNPSGGGKPTIVLAMETVNVADGKTALAESRDLYASVKPGKEELLCEVSYSKAGAKIHGRGVSGTNETLKKSRRSPLCSALSGPGS